MVKSPRLPPKKRKFSKQHLANLRAAHAKRRKKSPETMHEAVMQRLHITANLKQPKGLIDRMTQAIDKIKEQIERLETL